MRWMLPLALAGCAAAGDRARQLDLLRQYIEEGRFPVNEDVEEETPVFVDRHGAPCAVAYLMLKGGREDLVRKFVETNNYVRIGDLRESPVLDWIQASGLTQAECALIQPSYRWRRWSNYAFHPWGLQPGQFLSRGWIIPREYLARPNLIEPLRIRSHLRHAEGRLARELSNLGSLFIPPVVEEGGEDCEEVPLEPHPWLEAPEPAPFAPGWRSLYRI